MAFFLSAIGNEQQFDANGNPLVGGKINTYAAGTTTPAATYTSNSGATAQANPIVLNALGLSANPIWLNGGTAYKFVFTDANDVVLRTVDNISGTNDPAVASAVDQWVAFTAAPTFVSATSFTLAGDQTNTFQVGRRVKSTNTGGTGYHTITATAYASGTNLTTVTVSNDSVVLDSGLSAVSYGLASPVNPSLPNSSAVRFAMGVGDLVRTQGFRLTLTTGLPVTTADVVGASTLYACPYKGNEIALNTGSKWSVYKSAQFSIALAGLTANRPYDVFCYDNAGAPALEVLAWASDTARATAIDYLDGVPKKSGSNTHRYLGTFYATGATTTEDSDVNRYLWNYYHRAKRRLRKTGTNATWTYATNAWRQAQALTTNQVNWVCGVAEDAADLAVNTAANGSTGAFVNFKVGVGVDSTTVPTFDTPEASTINTGWFGARSGGSIAAAAGKHYAAWLEIATSGVSVTFLGNGSGEISGAVLA